MTMTMTHPNEVPQVSHALRTRREEVVTPTKKNLSSFEKLAKAGRVQYLLNDRWFTHSVAKDLYSSN